MGDDGAFFGETFNMLRLLLHVTERNEEWKISVTMAGGAKHGVQLPLHILPHTKPTWTNDHATAHITGFSKLRRADYLLIPFGKILLPRGRDCSLLGGWRSHELGYFRFLSAKGRCNGFLDFVPDDKR